MIVLLAASMARCAAPSLCPTDQELLAAVRKHGAATAEALTIEHADEDQVDFTSYQAPPAQSVSGVICGERLRSELSGDPPVINCKFKVRYAGKDSHVVVRMVQRDMWEIDKALAVTRKR